MTVEDEVEARLAAVSAVRYIKLGEAGAWATSAFAEGILPMKFQIVPHDPCAAGDWALVRQILLHAGRQAVADDLRELKAFYELDENCLWFTMADGHVWWIFAELPVLPHPNSSDDGAPARYRRTIGGWRRKSIGDEPLLKRSFSSALTRLASYKRTICEAKGREAYLLSRIRGVAAPLQTDAEVRRSALEDTALRLIQQLDQDDFELMADLILTRGGWQRQTHVGKGQVDHDLILTNPVTNEAAWVQVKSKANGKVLADYLDRFRRDGSCQHFIFMCHSPQAMPDMSGDNFLHLWTGPTLARRALGAGLLDWLIERAT